ncbi:MAG: hypothetical protein J6B34_00680 [Clostridia bacterium]|nr:hypothetical protein [Clostridia bacterium]
MKATYNDFLEANPNCSGFIDNPHAKMIFDFLNEDETIIKMLDFADKDKPALLGCVAELEALYDSIESPQLDLNDKFTRTAIGRMIKVIVEPFGYVVTKKKNIPRGVDTKYFNAASCYGMGGAATMRIVKRVEEI